jgi:hypothetical protein
MTCSYPNPTGCINAASNQYLAFQLERLATWAPAMLAGNFCFLLIKTAWCRMTGYHACCIILREMGWVELGAQSP